MHLFGYNHKSFNCNTKVNTSISIHNVYSTVNSTVYRIIEQNCRLTLTVHMSVHNIFYLITLKCVALNLIDFVLQFHQLRNILSLCTNSPVWHLPLRWSRCYKWEKGNKITGEKGNWKEYQEIKAKYLSFRHINIPYQQFCDYHLLFFWWQNHLARYFTKCSRRLHR